MRRHRADAARGGTATRGCTLTLAVLAVACATGVGRPGAVVHRADAPSAVERYCAWFGDADGNVLYFGEAAFWSAYREAGHDPRADLANPGPRQIGRFDLTKRELLPPIDLGGHEPRSGVWDVLASAGRVYFTSYFEEAGYVDLEDGSVTVFADALFWNELAPGPDGRILVSRYADTAGGGGAVVEISPEGEVLAEHALTAPPGAALAAKSPAWDPIRDEIWVTTDRLPLAKNSAPAAPATAFGRPTIVMDRDGLEVARFGTAEKPVEIQFVRFDARGNGYLSVSSDGRLELVVLSPGANRRDWPDTARILLDASFPSQLDFAQDIQVGEDGSIYVTRWSGAVHRVTAGGDVETWRLPRTTGSLYYTAVPTQDGICATRCGEVEVVCATDAGAVPAPARSDRKR